MPGATLLVAPQLRLFLRARHRADGVVTVPVDGTATLGHLVESVGVPLPEVGMLLAGSGDGDGALPVTQRATAGQTVRVEPATRPQATPTVPPRFLLDVHLGSLARRLRVLGVDAAWSPDADDDTLVDRAAAQRRVLLTKDRGLLKRRAVRHGAYVRGVGADAQLLDVVDRFRPPLAPYTRCPACNGLLAPVDRGAVEHVLKPGTRRSYEDFSRCEGCGRAFWQGAHARGLAAVVTLASAAARPPPGRRPLARPGVDHGCPRTGTLPGIPGTKVDPAAGKPPPGQPAGR